MTRCIILIVCSVFIIAASPTIQMHPLAPPDTNSPRTLLESFIETTNKAYHLYISGERGAMEIDYHLDRAIRSLDLSEVAPSILEDVGIESVLLLKEVLDRIEIPPFEEIPDRAAMRNKNYKKWNIPNTEITIALIEEGPRQGEYLFTADTVNRLMSYYERVEHLPYKPGSSIGAYEDYVMGIGSMIPGSIIRSLPRFFRSILHEQAIWQWVAMLIMMSLWSLVLGLVFYSTRRRVPGKPAQSSFKSFARKILFPLTLAVTTQFFTYFLDEQINFTGWVLTAIIYIGEVLFFIALVWMINISGNAIAAWLISKPRIHTDSIDANLIRVLSRVVTILILFFLLLNATSELGIPLTAVFASAGIVGLALALAARETIANLFGGINILMDRPFRTGDYIILDSGERGKVAEVGLRSTRIVTRERIRIKLASMLSVWMPGFEMSHAAMALPDILIIHTKAMKNITSPIYMIAVRNQPVKFICSSKK